MVDKLGESKELTDKSVVQGVRIRMQLQLTGQVVSLRGRWV